MQCDLLKYALSYLKARRNGQHIFILILNHSGKHITLPGNTALEHVKIRLSRDNKLDQDKLVEKEISQIVEDNLVKSPTGFDIDLSLNEN